MALQTAMNETLTRVGLKYVQDPSFFQAGNIFPRCSVNKLSATYPTYDKAYWMKNEAEVRVPGAESKGGTHARGTGSYSCEDIAFHEDVPFENIENDPEPLNPERAATRRVIQKIALYDELFFTTNFFKTGVWGTDGDKNAAWATPSSATPLNDIATGRTTVKKATGFDPNTLILSRDSFEALKFCDQITDRLKYTSSANVTADIIARMCEVDRVIVLNAVYDSAKYGATAAQNFIGSNGALLIYTPSSPSLEEPSAGYNFVWTGYGAEGFGVRRFWREENMAWRVEAHHYHDMALMAADLGYFIADTVTAS